MQSKSTLKFLPIILFFSSFLFFGTASAANFNYSPYNCPITNYAAPLLSDYSTCCPDLGDSAGLMIDGTQCPDATRILFKPDANTSATCIDTSSMQSKLSESATKNRVGFNCLQKEILPGCRAGNYQQCGDTCIAVNGALKTTCDVKFRGVKCDQTGCDSCKPNYTQCVAGDVCSLNKVGPNMTYGQTPTKCTIQQIKDGTCSLNLATDVYSCDQIGKTVSNYCTGECSLCPDGTTTSGRNASLCISYAERFIQIFEDGLTSLGGPAKDGKYDYSVTGTVDFMRNVFLKSDVAETLNWASPTLPPVFQDLLTNNGNNSYILCTASQPCPGGMACSDGGLCYTASGTAGTVCATVSQCNLGLVCDASGHCADPNAGNVSCSATVPCAGGKVCGTDLICHTAGGNAGTGCTSATDCAEGYFCNNAPARVCERMGNLSFFVGVTAPLNGARGGYRAANSLCEVAFTGSHICPTQEIIDSFAYQASTAPIYLKNSGKAWVNNGPPGYALTFSNDCGAWTSSSNRQYGSVWDFGTALSPSKDSRIQPCVANDIPFACCR